MNTHQFAKITISLIAKKEVLWIKVKLIALWQSWENSTKLSPRMQDFLFLTVTQLLKSDFLFLKCGRNGFLKTNFLLMILTDYESII